MQAVRVQAVSLLQQHAAQQNFINLRKYLWTFGESEDTSVHKAK